MALYASLAPLYDELFPFAPASLAYIESLVAPASGSDGPPRPRRALDAGCATGSLVLELAARGWDAIGIEPEDAMVDLAREKAAARSLPTARFALGDMLDARSIAASLFTEAGGDGDPKNGVAQRGADGSFELVLCLGNTLPHLPPEAAARFMAVARALLAPSGHLVLQLVNYAKPGIGPGYAFPSAAARGRRFERRYEAGPAGKLRFLVDLIGERDARHTELLLSPLTPEWLLAALGDAGFGPPRLSGGWDGAPFDAGLHSYLVVAASLGVPA